ncbi:MAG: homoserine dehydrogenase, partial [Ruminococcus sp.]|nr:homoserine dehydrogenase [Ruminococcus sp.]
IDYKDSVTAMYIRAIADDKNVAYNKAKELFSDIHVLENSDAKENELAFVCEPLSVGTIINNIEMLNESGIKVESAIRIGDL